MADLYNQGVNLPFPAVNAGAVVEDAFGILTNFYPNRYPLTDRLPKVSLGSLSFNLVTDSYRPRLGVVANSGSAVGSGVTSIPVGDSSVYDTGDVIEVNVSGTYEVMIVTGTTSGTPDTVQVVRGYAGTTAASIPDASSVYLITNTRTGGELNINAINRNPQVVEQYSQTVQHAYQVAGSLESATNYVSGYGTPVQRDKFFCMKHVEDDFETALYYGRGVKLASNGNRPGMKGLRSLIQTNNTAAPTNGAAYKPSDLIRDVPQASLSNGGQINMMIVDSTFMVGLSTWGIPQILLDAGESEFGVKIDMFQVPFLPGISIMQAPLLRPGTVIGLSYEEARIRMKRPLYDKPRGSRGDATEGDMIQEGAIELDNESHHAYVSGITGWAKQS